MSTKPTPRVTRITRTPRKSRSGFRMSNEMHTAISQRLLDELMQLTQTRQVRSRSTLIREALTVYAHKAHKIRVPADYQPPQAYHERLPLTVHIKPDSLRQEYETHAFKHRLTVSELLMRCIYAYVVGYITAQTTENTEENEGENT